MRRGTTGLAMLILAPILAGCGPDWQPSWNNASRPVVNADSLTVQRVVGEEPEFQPLQRESMQQLRLSAGELRTERPMTPDAALTGVPGYNPVPRPEVDAASRPQTTARPDAPLTPPTYPRGSSTPPPVASVPPRAPAPPPRSLAPAPIPQPGPTVRPEGRVVQVPGQAPATVSNSTGRVQTLSQPNNPNAGVAVDDGGTTTIIQPGGRVVTVPSNR